MTKKEELIEIEKSMKLFFKQYANGGESAWNALKRYIYIIVCEGLDMFLDISYGIKQIDPNNFEFKIEILGDVCDRITSATITFDEELYVGLPAPTPNIFNLDVVKTINSFGEELKLLSLSTLLFVGNGGSAAAVDQAYTVYIDLKNQNGQIIKNISADIIVEGLNIA